VLVPFDRILDAVAAGQFEGRRIDAGLIIHEGQLTYADQRLEIGRGHRPVVVRAHGPPLARWAANGIRKDLGVTVIHDVHRLLLESIEFGLEHRDEALSYAMSYGRGLNRAKGDQFVEMYVNQWTLDFGPVVAKPSPRLLAEATRPA